MQIDYLIIGQGISGTFLSYYLHAAGKKVLIIDKSQSNSASRVASGVINPVTGRRIVRTWLIEDMLPFARQEYTLLGDQLGLTLVKECNVLDFHPTLQMKDAFDKRLVEEPEYLEATASLPWKEVFNFHFGVGKIHPCLLVDLHSLIGHWRMKMKSDRLLIEETFDAACLEVRDGHVSYKNVTAAKIIFCDGVNGIANQFFKNLPYSLNKGEALIARIPGLNEDFIYKHGLSIVPWRDGLWWIGSSYEWTFENGSPTVSFRQKTELFLKNFLKLPFEIVDHLASLRPANLERRPFVGLHPAFQQVGLLNGMGTKGCSLAPYFAKQFADLLIHQKSINPLADVKRFEKILARKMD